MTGLAGRLAINSTGTGTSSGNGTGSGGDHAPTVLVVGAGPVGVTAATMLAARGIATLVVDRHPGVYPLPRAVHIDDEIRRVLQGLDPTAPLDPLMMPTGGLRLLDARHRTMAEFNRSKPVGEHGHPQANMYDQPALESWLRERLAACPNATLAGGVELTGLDQDSTGATATLWDINTGEVAQFRADAVLGCDGANSTVRDLIGSRMQDLRFEERWLVVDVATRHSLDAWLGVHQVCDPRRAATFMQVAPGRYRWEFRLQPGEDVADLIAEPRLAELVRPWTKQIPFDQLDVLRSAEYAFKARIADRWRDRRVFLLGDAAHLTPPFIGQGLCAGVRDAANLTWKVADVLHSRLDESVLDTYQSERAPHARALIAKAVLVGRVMTGGQDAMAMVRKVALAALCRIPGLSDRVLDAPPPPLAAGPLVHRPPQGRRRSRAGRLVPQPRVQVQGSEVLLDAVLGQGFTVLTLEVPSPALQAAAATAGAKVVHIRSATRPGAATPQIATPPAAAPPGTVLTAEDAHGELDAWMRAGRAISVLVRPDRVVLDQDNLRDGGRRLAARLNQWSHRYQASGPSPGPSDDSSVQGVRASTPDPVPPHPRSASS